MKSRELLDEARGINTHLQRAQQSLAWSVAQSESTQAVLRRDGETLDDSLREHRSELRSALESTRRRLRRIQRSEECEEAALRAAVLCFSAAVLWILCVRLRVLAVLWDLVYCSLAAWSAARQQAGKEL